MGKLEVSVTVRTKKRGTMAFVCDVAEHGDGSAIRFLPQCKLCLYQYRTTPFRRVTTTGGLGYLEDWFGRACDLTAAPHP